MPRSPFYPGMDPFLEDAAYWEGFHDVLVTCMMFNIEQRLPDGYVSNVKERAELIRIDDPAAKVYVPDIGVAREVPPRPRSTPDEGGGGVAVEVEIEVEHVTMESVDAIEVREAYIEILRVPGYELVTVIELMSPWNKHGAGIGVHEKKRASHVRDGVHFVEIDLLLEGKRTKLASPLPKGDYYGMMFRGDNAPRVDVFAWDLKAKLPKLKIPLRAPDPDVALDLCEALHSAYEQGRYDRKLRYGRGYEPKLEGANGDWLKEKIKPVLRPAQA